MANQQVLKIVDPNQQTETISLLEYLPNLDAASLIVSIIGVLIAIYTLKRVTSVQKAQAQERKMTEELLDIDHIEEEYRETINYLSNENTVESKELAQKLGLRLGAILGTRRALNKVKKTTIESKEIFHDGYLTESFLINEIKNCRFQLDILTGRALIVTSFAVREQLRLACERGVKIRIVSLCEKTPLKTLNDALQTVAYPAAHDAQEYRKEISSTTKTMLADLQTWPTTAKRNIEYRLSSCVPRLSLIRSDQQINFGFLMLYRDAQSKNSAERQFIRIPTNSKTGMVILKHVQLLFKSNGRNLWSLGKCGFN